MAIACAARGRERGSRCSNSGSFLWMWLAPLAVVAVGPDQNCTTAQWQADSCPWPRDGFCDNEADVSYCDLSSDCFDCDPCGVLGSGVVGCSECVGLSAGCMWCEATRTCMSDTAPTSLYSCSTGWNSTLESCNVYTTVGGQTFNDPAVEAQRWYLEAINVTGAWALGYTGAGVNVMFADDALDATHPDFADKFDPRGGSPADEVLPVSVPWSRRRSHADQNHGTAVAGYAVAAANNSECGVGVAFGANLSFVRFNPLPSLLEGFSVNDVYSNSWMLVNCEPKDLNTLPASLDYTVVGRSSDNICPFDDTYASSPCTMCVDMLWNGSSITRGCVQSIKNYCQGYPWNGGTSYDPACSDHWDLWVTCLDIQTYWLWHTRMHYGVVNGRGGRGIVYTFAAGNEFQQGHNLNNNVFGKSVFTIAVGATAQDAEHSYYSSPGASLLISAPGGEVNNGPMISSAPEQYGRGSCKDGGQGTSYACPLVTGVVALMLEANQNLTWRDVQEIFYRTADVIHEEHTSWTLNGAGRYHSDLYGFGQINAGNAVVMARDWTEADSTPHAMVAKLVEMTDEIPAEIGGVLCGVEVTSDEASQMASVEHVVIHVSTEEHEGLGELEVTLISPAGTESVLAWASAGAWDGSGNGTGLANAQYSKHKFVTVKNWGESAAGLWTLRVVDRRDNAHKGRMNSWVLAIYGKCKSSADASSCRLATMPSSVRICNDDCPSSNDSICDDGGIFASHADKCSYGSDCSDCGTRYAFEGDRIMLDWTGVGATDIEGQAACTVANVNTSSTSSSVSSVNTSSTSSSVSSSASSSTSVSASTLSSSSTSVSSSSKTSSSSATSSTSTMTSSSSATSSSSLTTTSSTTTTTTSSPSSSSSSSISSSSPSSASTTTTSSSNVSDTDGTDSLDVSSAFQIAVPLVAPLWMMVLQAVL